MTYEEWSTTHDDGFQPIAIGHLCDSDDLKIQASLAQSILGQMEFKNFFFQMNGPFSTPFPQEGNNTCIDNFWKSFPQQMSQFQPNLAKTCLVKGTQVWTNEGPFIFFQKED